MTDPIPGTEVTDERAGALYRPLGTYAALTGAFIAGFGTVLAVAEARKRLDREVGLTDIALIGIASHKLSRLVSKDEVAAFVRAPFVEVREEEGRIKEDPTGSGPRRAVGRLLTCPSCVGQWAAAGFVAGHVWAPRTTRAVAAVFAADAVSDFLHVAYRGLKDRA
jgi:Protein of unknown function (DUF1360)